MFLGLVTTMRRREFITSLGSAAAVWPLAARAQQPARLRRIGVLMIHAEGESEGQARVGAFRKQLADLGWFENRNVQIDYRWGVAEATRAQVMAAELVALAPDVIVANGTAATAAAQKTTRRIPVVFVVVTDPVGAGFVESQARPGGNITGFSTFEPEIGGKWLELLRDITPACAGWLASSIRPLPDLPRSGARSKSWRPKPACRSPPWCFAIPPTTSKERWPRSRASQVAA